MKQKITARLIAQSIVVLVCAYTLKQYYSTASADQLRWILLPTTACVELLSGESFEFESHSGYISANHSFLIAASCAGVNFLLTAFLMLSIRNLLFDSRKKRSWAFIPSSLLAAYFVTLLANTIRILLAMQLQQMDLRIGFLDPDQLHRLEGIFVYFLFLSLLFLISDRPSRENNQGLKRQWLLPLIVYYATMVGIPLVNGAYRRTNNFWEYAIVVLMVPLVLTAIVTLVNAWHVRTRIRLQLVSTVPANEPAPAGDSI
jgi:exosortase K